MLVPSMIFDRCHNQHSVVIAAEPRVVTPVVNIITCNYNWKGSWGGGGVLPYISFIGSAAPSGRVFAPFWSENGYTLCPFRSGIAYGQLRELRECMNVFIVSISNE